MCAWRRLHRLLGLLLLLIASLSQAGPGLQTLRFEHLGREQPGEQLQRVDGSAPSRARSALYVPLKLRGVVLGVVSVLSERPDAFSQTHRAMLETLAAYAAVALDNAQAYRQLQAAQSELVEQRKQAALGHLVAGVAHEMNTPLGNALMAASTLQAGQQGLAAELAAGQLRKSSLQGFLSHADDAQALLLRSLQTAASLVSRFKQLAVQPDPAQRRRFALAELSEALRLAHLRQIEAGEHRLLIEFNDVSGGELVLDSDPQVLDQLIDNALRHGLAGRQGGTLTLRAEPLAPGRLRLQLSDDGAGIAPQKLPRIFEPFFTTQMGTGTNGLGLHLCYVLVHAVLGGEIRAHSAPGQGTTIELLLPLSAPAA